MRLYELHNGEDDTLTLFFSFNSARNALAKLGNKNPNYALHFIYRWPVMDYFYYQYLEFKKRRGIAKKKDFFTGYENVDIYWWSENSKCVVDAYGKKVEL